MRNPVLESCIFSFKLLDLLIFGVFLIKAWSIVGLLGIKRKVFELLQEGIFERIQILKEFFLELLDIFLFS